MVKTGLMPAFVVLIRRIDDLLEHQSWIDPASALRRKNKAANGVDTAHY
jgi:hypothetical protein